MQGFSLIKETRWGKNQQEIMRNLIFWLPSCFLETTQFLWAKPFAPNKRGSFASSENVDDCGQDNQKNHESNMFHIYYDISVSVLIYVSPSERGSTQSEPPQVFQESGEREGSRLDRGRGRVPSTPTPEGLFSRVRSRRELPLWSDGPQWSVVHLSCNLLYKLPTSLSLTNQSVSLS